MIFCTLFGIGVHGAIIIHLVHFVNSENDI
nr:MAG TPA: hypothetical protein [Caudoviricetes sp.]DAO56621.1 MAG TPA: hypothetical protein [Caudoviricetes sp.]